jgi:hypothetical protein
MYDKNKPLFYCYAGWGYIVVLTKVLTMHQIYHTCIHPLHHSLSSPPPLIPGIVSADLIFPFIYMCTQYLYHIHLPSQFRHLLPTSHQYQPSPWAGPIPSSCSLILCEERKGKKMTFLLFKIATQVVEFLVALPCIYVL